MRKDIFRAGQCAALSVKIHCLWFFRQFIVRALESSCGLRREQGRAREWVGVGVSSGGDENIFFFFFFFFLDILPFFTFYFSSLTAFLNTLCF